VSLVKLVEYQGAPAEVRAVYEDIMKTRGVDWVGNFWKGLANDPAQLRRTWEQVKQVMAPGALDPLVKEMLYIAVSATNGCEYCTYSHTASARNKGMSDAMFMELMAVVGLANQTNRVVNGLRIEGVYIHPLDAPAAGRAPLAILPHGGPEGISYDNWNTNPLYPAQVLAVNGYAVLMPNYRGSGGRGVEFSKADHRDLGGEEFEDVLLGIDDLAARGWVDRDRVGISGTSYGGYFSALAGTRYSDRFRLAIPFAGITNWVSFTGTTDIPVEMSEVHWDLWWWDNPGLAMDRSPVAHLNHARTPMLIGHGMADERVHPEQSIQLYQGLKLKGVPVELVLYPREPHGLRERAHQLDYMKRIVEWFDRYVKGPKVTTD